MKPTPEQLLEVARDLLGRFVQAKFPPVDYLCELNRSGFTGALGNFRHQLEGRKGWPHDAPGTRSRSPAPV